MPCVGVARYLINGFVPSGKRYDFECECGHAMSIDSLGRVFWYFVFSVWFTAFFLAVLDDDEVMPWIAGCLALFMIGCFGYEVYKRLRAPEIA
jgi:hypothetical protein